MNATYNLTARTLHWLMAVLIVGLLILGIYMHELPLSPQKLQLYAWHKWAGVTAFALVLFRLYWRLTRPAPPLPEHMSALAKFAAHAAHSLIYILLVLIPLSGWLMSSAKGFQTVYFGMLPIPDLLTKDRELGELLTEVHKLLNISFIAVLLGHVGAALYHQFIRKDGLLKRMSA